MAAGTPSVLTADMGRAFEDADVARCYACRPPYPPELFEALLSLTPGRRRAADLGCGPGKIARVLAGRFQTVDAVDPSRALLALGRELDAGVHANIRWIEATAEAVDLGAPVDLVTAGSSIHWMRHDILFPKLARIMEPAGVVAIIAGDGAADPPWQAAWTDFLRSWLARLGREYDAEGFRSALESYRPWLAVSGEASFSCLCSQTVGEFIECQHSREALARRRFAPGQAEAFDSELAALLAPHADKGRLQFTVTSTLVWGRARSAAA